MPIVVIYELIKRLFFPLIFPLIIAATMYYKGYSAGSKAVRAEIQEAQIQTSELLRDAEEKNEDIRYAQEKDRRDIYDTNICNVVGMFNTYFGAKSKSCYSGKAHKAENQGLLEVCHTPKDFRGLYLYLKAQDDYIYQLLNLMAPVIKSTQRKELKDQSIR